MREFFIAGRRIADDTMPFLVAESGHNHQGSMEQAEALILAARRADADAVKFQKRDNRILFTDALYNQPYNSEHAFGATYGKHREALEFCWGEYQHLKGYAESLGLVFFATAFDIPSADFLARLKVPVIKIASGDLTNWSLQEHVTSLNLPMIVSTGGADIGTVEATVDNLVAHGARFALLQCTMAYPAKPGSLNLKVIETYRRRFPDIVIGLSDHEDGIAFAPVAYALGARIFEKHLTLNRSLKGTDQAFSIEPHTFWQMSHQLRTIGGALGDGEKVPYPEEGSPLTKMGKSLVAAHPLPAGHRLNSEDIAIKSPGGGMSPERINKLIGKDLLQEVKQDEQFSS